MSPRLARLIMPPVVITVVARSADILNPPIADAA
jgi:hypothetical protein